MTHLNRVKPLVVSLLPVFLLACSNGSSNSSSSSNISVNVYANQQDVSSATVTHALLEESGQTVNDAVGIVRGTQIFTDSKGYAQAVTTLGESMIVELRTRNSDGNGYVATQQKCQWVAGCSVSGKTVAFAEMFVPDYVSAYRSVVYKPGNKSRLNVNALTHLAQQHAYQLDVLNSTSQPLALQNNQTFSPYDIELANSQLSNLFNVGDIISTVPADLSQLSALSGDAAAKNQSIVYGALLAAWQNFELTKTNFGALATKQYVANAGQFYQLDADNNKNQAVTLSEWLLAAKQNLSALVDKQGSSSNKALLNTAITSLDTLAVDLQEDQLSVAKYSNITTLIDQSELDDIELGLAQTKAFVKQLKDYQSVYWTAGYEPQLKAYGDKIEVFNQQHAKNIDSAVQQYFALYEYFNSCLNTVCDAANQWHGKAVWDASSKKLTVAVQGIEVEQKVVNLSPTSAAEVTQSQAIELYIKGRFEVVDANSGKKLQLSVDHNYNSDKSAITSPTRLRVYYPQAVSQISNTLEPVGFGITWLNLNVYDPDAVGTAEEIQLEGGYSATYLAVKKPCLDASCAVSETRYNLEQVAATLQFSNKTSTIDTVDSENGVFAVTARASNADTYYPTTKFAAFNGLLQANDKDITTPDTIDDLLDYQVGTQNVLVGGKSVELKIVDFISKFSDDVRYRFYPEEIQQDVFDSDKDGNTTENVTRYKLEECLIEKQTSGEYLVKSCSPKIQIWKKQNVQDTINDLWESGAFRKVLVEGVANYYIDFPTEQDANGCYVLKDLNDKSGSGFSGQGKLIEHEKAVQGLDALALSTEVQLKDASGNVLPRTLLTANIIAEREDSFKVDLALSHNYDASRVTSDATLGLLVGNDVNARIFRASYDTRNQLINSGFFSLYKAGVSLTLADPINGQTNSIADINTMTFYYQDRLSFPALGAEVPYKEIVDANGEVDRCVLAPDLSKPEQVGQASLGDQVFYINYRGTIYGTIRAESGVWVVRYLDDSSDNSSFSSWETLL